MFVSSINGVPTDGEPDQVTIDIDDCISLTYRVRFNDGSVVDVTLDPNTTFFTDPSQGTLVGNSFCATEEECDKIFTIYGRFFSDCAQQGITDTVIIHVP
jgi:hypothetical protein